MAVSFFIGLVVLAVPFAVGLGACSVFSLIGLCSTGALYLTFAVALGLLTLMGAAGGLVVFLAWRAIPAPAQLLIAALLFVAGLALLQPELDAVALLGLLFTLKGVSKAPPGPAS